MLTLISVSVPPRVTAAARKRSRSFDSAKRAGGRLQINTHALYVCGFALNDMVHGCMVYTERAETAAVSCGTSHASAVSIPFWWIFKNALKKKKKKKKKLFTHVESYVNALGLLESGE